MRTPRICLLLLLAGGLIGCPESDDITLVRDSGGRVDAITDQPDVPFVPTDLGKEDDFGVAEPDVPQGECQVAADCAFLNPKPCQIAVCTVGKCQLSPAANDAPCDDGNACTITACSGGACIKTGDVACDDGNACTADHCDKITGCMSINTLGVPCDDGDPCTSEDACSDGVCKGGPLVCDLGSLENPAQHCNQIKSVDPSATSGVYWVKRVGGGDPLQVYCEMTIAGGGWTRIGLVVADKPICNYFQGFGDPDDILGAPAQTTVLSAAAVALIPRASSDILLALNAGTVVLRSPSPQWSWAGVADGTINSVTLVDYNVTASVNGAAFEPLSSPGVPPPLKGPSLLTGNLPNGKSIMALGIGGNWSNTFEQNATCAGYQQKGWWGGTAIGPSTWGQSGAIFVK